MGLLRGPADRQRAARRPPRAGARVQGHLPALPDDARALRRAQGRLGLPRPAGRDRGRAEARLHLQGRHRALRHRRVQRAVPRVGLRVPRGLDGADRAHRLLGRPRAPLPHARPRLRRVGLVGAASTIWERTCSTRATRSCPTARAAAPRCPRTRSRRATRTSRTRRSTCASRSPRPAGPLRAGDELLVWTTTPWTLRLQRRGRRRPRADLRARDRTRAAIVLAEALVEQRARRGRARSLDALPRRASSSALRYEPPFAFIAAAEYGEQGPHRAARRLRHRRRRHRPRAHRDRVRRGRLPARPGAGPRRSSTRCGSTAPTTSASARTPGAWSRTPTPTSSRTCARAAGCCAPRLRARLPALLALRHAAALLRQAVLVHRDVAAARPAAGRQRDGQLAPGAHQARALRQLAREQRRLGALARALLGHAAAGLALRERPRRSASGRSPSWRSSPGEALEDPHRPYVDDVDVPVRASAASRCAACPRSSTSGSTRAACRSRSTTRRSRTRSLREQLPGRLHLRGARPDARLVLLAAGGLDAAVRPLALRERRLPRADPRRRGPEDVEVARATSSCPGRSSTATAPTRCAGTSSPPSSRGTATASRRRRSARRVRQFLLQLWNTYGFYVLYANVNDVDRARRPRADRARPLGRSRAWRRPSRRSPSASTHFDATLAGRAIAAFVDDLSNWYVRRSRRRFWDGDPAPSRRCAHCLVTSRSCSRRSRRSSPTRSTTTSTAREPSVHLCDWPGAGERDAALEVAWRVARETVRLGLRRARPGEDQGAPAAARGGRRRRRRASARRSSGSADVVREELNVKELRFVDAGRRARLLRAQAELPHARPALRQGDAAGRRRGRGARRRARRGGAARRRGRSASASTATTTSSAPTTCSSRMQPLEGYQLEREGSHAVALELALDDELRREGLAREVVHAVQNARKARGPRGRGPHRAALGGDDELLAAAREHEDYVTRRDAGADGRLRRRRRRGGRHHRRPRAADRGGARLGQRGLELGLGRRCR